jgi:polyhydroxybutyrate depolymerase
MAKLTGFDALADREGIVVAYPDGIRRSWADGRLGTPADRQGVDDVGFLRALVREVAAHERIDLTRVYVAGMSNGGFMSERLACEASDLFAAVGVVAATLGENIAATCKPTHPIPIAYFNGTEDPLVPYNGGVLGADRGRVLGAEESVQRWATLNGCTGAPVETALPQRTADGTSVRERAWTTCRDAAEVRAYRVEGGGHAWPGGWAYLGERLIGRTSRNVDASAVLWEFFARHRR